MTFGAFAAGVQLALATTREHKMRSFLTVLGVIIGTGAVIGVGSIVAGLDGAITNILRSFGPNTMIVLKTPSMGAPTPEERRRKFLRPCSWETGSQKRMAGSWEASQHILTSKTC